MVSSAGEKQDTKLMKLESQKEICMNNAYFVTREFLQGSYLDGQRFYNSTKIIKYPVYTLLGTFSHVIIFS
jgi:hypothetical protein